MTGNSYGTVHPDAPEQLATFAFLVGKWKCKGKVKAEEGQWRTFTADWVGQYILDGMAIGDEFRAVWDDGTLFKHGQNIRIYNVQQQSWRMKWIDALEATVISQGTKELGGVKVNGSGICFHILHESGEILRAQYINITDDSCQWHGSMLNEDDETWDEVMVIEATRDEE